MRARLWYGPAAHGVGLDRVARYLRGPLGCRAETRVRQRHGKSFEQIVLSDPVPVVIEMDRRPEVSGEAADLVSRLPAKAPPGLADKLAACTARLDLYDGPGGARLAPATATARSVLVPLAFAMDAIVEEVDSGRLLFFPLPEPPRQPLLLAVLDAVLGGLGRLLALLALRR
ncbi:hypothetical protein [Rhodovulum euryhalinum]|uniref:hypothetical protein n=1 Tax=Rhodovulum euryhalinum TaxID=35805 RepID=UPI001045DA9F|nr:hypothetical protein [Rhodovulum euryhalinum]